MEAPLKSATDENVYPNLELAQMIYEFEQGKTNKQEEIITIIKENDMASLYLDLTTKFGWDVDDNLLTKMTEANATKLTELEEAEKEAKENAGEIEQLDQLFARARYFAQTGQWKLAYDAYDAILAGKKTGSGKKIDASLEKIRIALFLIDSSKLKDFIVKTKELVERGGDWDRRNRLKTYEAMYLITCRDIKGAAKLLLDCVATFSATELFSYEKFMFYTVITSIATLSRTEMKTKMVKNPQVASVIREVPLMEPLMSSIYNCEYKEFFQNIVNVQPVIANDRYLGPHTSYILREYRIISYGQFLEAYKSVMLSSMAASFGITVDMMDTELARFIANGRLNAKIDKVGDVVETIRPDKKSAQYHEIMKKGDVLLTSIQRLSRQLDM